MEKSASSWIKPWRRSMLLSVCLAAAGSAHAALLEPYNVKVESYPNAATATVRWSADAPAAFGFRLERRLPGGAWGQVSYLSGDQWRQATDSTLSAATAYEYRVVSFRPGGPAAGYPSAAVGFASPKTTAVAADYDRAAIPRALDAQPLSATELYLSWRDVTQDETGFRIETRPAGGTWTLLATAAANTTRLRVTGRSAGASYEFRISAQRPVGSALMSAPVAVTMPTAAAPRVFFVDAGAPGNDANPGTESQPWKTLQHAANVLAPGQTALVRGGTYTRNTYFALVSISRSGSAGAPLTFKAYPGERPVLRSTYDVNYHVFYIKGSYIVIDGFDIVGHLSEVTRAVADAENAAAAAGTTPGPKTDSNGISIDGRSGATPHHITVRNNTVHSHPGGGINANFADYVTIENNRVYSTSSYSPYGTSGISILSPKGIDSNTSAYKYVIRSNIVSGAQNLYPCKCTGYTKITDGNGIILDSFTGNAYGGRSLIANNIVFGNGGRGIHIFKTDNVDIGWNTASNNSQIAATGDGEITAIYAGKTRVYNNILVARGDRPANKVLSPDASVVFDKNIVFGGNSFTTTGTGTTNRIGINPRFAPGTGADAFHLRGDSPAVDTGTATPLSVPADDALRMPRVRGAAADVGAVESF